MRLHAVAGSQDAGLNAVPGPQDAGPSAAGAGRAYDAIAADYDAQVQGDAWMRTALHAHYLRAFARGQRILDIGCGTGIDAVFLAEHGIRVVGIDASAGMLAQFRLRAQRAGLADRLEAHLLDLADLHRLPDDQPFDGLIAAFASLSSARNLDAFAAQAQQRVRPGGRLVLHLLNRFSSWEFLGLLRARRFSDAAQLAHQHQRCFRIGGYPVAHRLYFATDAYRAHFAHGFRLRDHYGLGWLRPPHTVRRIPPSIIRPLEWLDVRLGRLPPLDRLGRFFVLDLERR